MSRTSAVAALLGLRGRARRAPGLLHGQPMLLAPLTPHVYRPPAVNGHAWIGAWKDRSAFDAFKDELPPDDYRVLLRPVRVVGRWSAHPGLPRDEQPAGGGSTAVLTLGHLKPTRISGFLQASAKAERDALQNPAMSFGTAMASPSLTVATFSIWNDLSAMRDFVSDRGHGKAMTRHSQHPFHRESAFIRYEILAHSGTPPQHAQPNHG